MQLILYRIAFMRIILQDIQNPTKSHKNVFYKKILYNILGFCVENLTIYDLMLIMFYFLMYFEQIVIIGFSSLEYIVDINTNYQLICNFQTISETQINATPIYNFPSAYS